LQPLDYSNGRHQGFAFVEFGEADDAEEAIFNMNGADLLGRILKVSLAQANQANKYTKANEAIWKSDDWFQKNTGQDQEAIEAQKQKQQDSETLQVL
jgi:peptidyl-prolyl isomerase E (cyclophilin E)